VIGREVGAMEEPGKAEESKEAAKKALHDMLDKMVGDISGMVCKRIIPCGHEDCVDEGKQIVYDRLQGLVTEAWNRQQERLGTVELTWVMEMLLAFFAGCNLMASFFTGIGKEWLYEESEEEESDGEEEVH